MKKFIVGTLVTITSMCSITTYAAPSYPAQTIKIVVPYPPGGGSDAVGRLFARYLAEEIDQPVVVENLSGAGGTIGAMAVVKAKPDGYTLFMGNTGPNAISPNLLESIPYDINKDFTPVTLVATQPLFVLVNKDSEYETFADLIKASKQKPGVYNFSSSGTGGLSHLAGELINTVTGSDFQHIPYKGGAPAMVAIHSKDVEFHTPSAVDGVQQVKGGNLKGLAVTSTERWKATPDVPTVEEAGYPELEINFWYGLFAPANLPEDVQETLAELSRKALNNPEAIKAFEDLGSTASPSTSEELANLVVEESQRYKKIIEDAGIPKQ